MHIKGFGNCSKIKIGSLRLSQNTSKTVQEILGKLIEISGWQVHKARTSLLYPFLVPSSLRTGKVGEVKAVSISICDY